jgi:hypothetical protein
VDDENRLDRAARQAEEAQRKPVRDAVVIPPDDEEPFVGVRVSER